MMYLRKAGFLLAVIVTIVLFAGCEKDDNDTSYEELQRFLTWADYVRNGERYMDFTLQENIDLSGIEWEPMGDLLHPYMGTFNGNGKVIYNLTVKGLYKYAGLFGRCVRATIVNTHLNNVAIKESLGANAEYCGALVGYAHESTISQCSSSGSIEAGKTTGGLIGSAVDTHITRSYSSCAVSSSYFGKIAGGLIGEADKSHVVGSKASGNVSTIHSLTYVYTGGLLGSCNSGFIYYSYATGAVYSSSKDYNNFYTAFIAHVEEYSNVRYCYTTQDVFVNNDTYSIVSSCWKNGEVAEDGVTNTGNAVDIVRDPGDEGISGIRTWTGSAIETRTFKGTGVWTTSVMPKINFDYAGE